MNRPVTWIHILRMRLQDFLRTVANEWGRAVIMVTHDAHIASFADRILFLKDGAILFDKKRPENTPPGADWVSDMVRRTA